MIVDIEVAELVTVYADIHPALVVGFFALIVIVIVARLLAAELGRN